MTFRRTVRALSAVAVLAIALSGPGFAQQPAAQPKISPTAMLLAKELVDLKGAAAAYDPLVNGVIEYHKNFFIQNNPNLAKDLDQIAQKLSADLAPRKAEMQQEITRIYASHFTEQELKDALAFYKSPLGKKLIAEEPKALEETLKAADDWSRKFAGEVDAKFRAEMQKRGKNLI
ncbi:DUF2059 domain-containing protein [Rhodoplanes sp. Z2-YC6860]|uniref:DUF2059 domain-containing protein n=1 Tax=Rhodoplanes sp. Z2-YC6860 TaxID=674703 RepID=UPI00078BB713|nr:DUF2059 domain-containing protein [Rhodoplanes sp. Z2-YC6860]AMN41602.1 hypothetical protein RHPLAN_31670 [Rhodoplanes sp. Z2-YC6860]